MIKITLLVLLCVSATLAVNGNKGACKTKNYKTVDVDWTKCLGSWYNMAASQTALPVGESNGCTSMIYKKYADDTIDVTQVTTLADESRQFIISYANIYGPGQFRLSYFQIPQVGIRYETVYVSDDYSVIAFVECSGIFQFFGSSNVWIFARNFTVDPQQVQLAISKVSAQGFDVSDVIPVSTSYCVAQL